MPHQQLSTTLSSAQCALAVCDKLHRVPLASTILLLFWAPFLLAAAPADRFDAAADFSSAKNPNGVWEYGYSETNSLAPDQFRPDTYARQVGLIVFWHPLT